MQKHKPLALIILDGWGMREEKTHNAIALASTPFFDSLWKDYPHSLLSASGESVGLPAGQMGNSEVGHTTIGAGKILDTDLVRISKAAEKGEFSQNPAITMLFDHVKKYGSTLHIKGLVSPGGVHSHHDHLYALIKAAKNSGIAKIAIHAFTDGRDSPPQSAHAYLKELEEVLKDVGIGHIATVTGRFYAMDRDKNWHRIAVAQDAIFHGRGKKFFYNKTLPSQAVAELYKQGLVDEMLEPMVFLDDANNSWQISANDGVIFFNFRSDRARQISETILQKKKELNLCFATLTQYEESGESLVAFPPQRPETTLAAEIAMAGLTQTHIAETEKFAHVTYFFNGGRETPHEGERHIVISSRKDIQTHDQAPEMQAAEIANEAIKAIRQNSDFILVNFANADMVGHTANEPAVIKAVESVDAELEKVVKAVLENNGTAIITADHGNAEFTIDPATGEKHTAHTTSPVPFIITDKNLRVSSGGLSDIAPTVLELLGLPKPENMSGRSLIIK